MSFTSCIHLISAISCMWSNRSTCSTIVAPVCVSILLPVVYLPFALSVPYGPSALPFMSAPLHQFVQLVVPLQYFPSFLSLLDILFVLPHSTFSIASTKCICNRSSICSASSINSTSSVFLLVVHVL